MFIAFIYNVNLNPRKIFQHTARYLDKDFPWPEPEEVGRVLAENRFVPGFLSDLARLERVAYRIATEKSTFSESVDTWCINPSLEIVTLSWTGLAALLQGEDVFPVEKNEYLAVYKKDAQSVVSYVPLSNHDLLALKIVAEKLDRFDIAKQEEISVGQLDTVLEEAVRKRLVFGPASSIVHSFSSKEVETFTLQWHLTLQCDLHCKHCYDRTDRKRMSYDEALRVLDIFYDFCATRHVTGQVSFTGGNPVLYPHFEEVYRQAARRGFLTAVLGNPVSREWLDKMNAIQKPEFYQVSLEGLREHNDYIRGKGFFDRVLAFLDLLEDAGIYRLVMLTLTRENQKDLLPLVKLLKNRVEKFNFNRLASFGEGAQLASIAPDDYMELLEQYRAYSLDEPHAGCKDNFFNILQDRDDYSLLGGCTGYGCGAALNFVAVLPDGEVHACRKLPSKIGNIFETSLDDIYDSELAERYRLGSSACNGCRIRHVCGGCLAVTAGQGRDIFTEIDPYCFISEKK